MPTNADSASSPITVADLAAELGVPVLAVSERVSALCRRLGAPAVVHTAAGSNGRTLLHGATARIIRAEHRLNSHLSKERLMTDQTDTVRVDMAPGADSGGAIAEAILGGKSIVLHDSDHPEVPGVGIGIEITAAAGPEQPEAMNARRLGRLLTDTTPHMSDDERLPALRGVRLESDGKRLFALASDRHTFAVSRTHYESGQVWEATVPAAELAVLRAWLDAHRYDATVGIEYTAGALTFTGDRGTYRILTPAVMFPAWRGLFRTAMQEAAAEVPFAAWNSEFLARWQACGRTLKVWQPAQNKPLVIVADEFLGMQMPLRFTGKKEETREAAAADWLTVFGDADTPVTPADVLPVPQGPALTHTVDNMSKDLLEQVVYSTSDLFDAPSNDPGAVAAHAVAGTHAWIGYRLLQELRCSDPKLAAKVVAELGEQLESGEVGEWAWDTAVEDGHDPDQWVKDYKERKARRAEREAAKAAAAETAAGAEAQGVEPGAVPAAAQA